MSVALTEETMDEFVKLAVQSAPQEACALAAVVHGKMRLYPCKNVADKPEIDFLLNPADYINVTDLVEKYEGEVVALIHSHPKSVHLPTDADKAGCEASGLGWSIYSLVTKEWHHFSPTGYQVPLIGRQFKHGVFDCYSALRDWYKENKKVVLPDFIRRDLWWKKGDNLFMENFMAAGFVQINLDELQPGDGLLMHMDSPVVNHCAVYLGNDKIFHQLMNRLSCRQIYGGMFKKNTRMAVRYIGGIQ